PLKNLLNPDGTLNLDDRYHGKVIANGWRITNGRDGKPRFIQDSSVSSVSGSGKSDDVYWNGFALPGLNGPIYAVAVQGPLVWLGGNFTKAAGAPANHIAVWNSNTFQWSEPSGGINGTVYAITVHGDDVFVGGDFS